MVLGWTSEGPDGTEGGTARRGEGHPPAQAVHQARKLTSIYLACSDFRDRFRE